MPDPQEPRPTAALGLWRGAWDPAQGNQHHGRSGCTHLELPDVPLGHQVMLILRREAIGQSLGEVGEGREAQLGPGHPLRGPACPCPTPQIRATCDLALKSHMNGGREHM